MATGDQLDIFARLSERIPRGWFGSVHPVLDAVLMGIANVLAGVYASYVFMLAQTRIQTSTSGWLDLSAADYFGPTGLLRLTNEQDPVYRNRILVNIIRERGTRNAVIKVLTDLTGRAPVIVEPQRPLDTGSYGSTEAVTFVGSPQFYRTDWQGAQLLYSTPRTNLFLQSSNLLSSAWISSRVGSAVAAIGPDGSGNAALVTSNASGGTYLYQAISMTSGVPVPLMALAKAGSINVVNITSFTQVGSCSFTLTGAGVAGSPSGIASAPFISYLGNGWYLYGCTLTPTSTGSNNISTCNFPGSSGDTFTFFGPQCGSVGGYIPTTTAPVTVTDYTLAGSTVTLAAPLAFGASLSWTGQYQSVILGATVSVTNQVIGVGNAQLSAFTVGRAYGYVGGYGKAGAYGSMLLPYQAFVTAYRPIGTGIPNVGGYGTSSAGYSQASQAEYAGINQVTNAVSDAAIYAAVASVLPVATIAWMRISS